MLNLMRCTKLLILLFTVMVFSACMTSSPRNRGSLSDAMDKSRDDYEDEREVPDEPDPWEIEEEPDNRAPDDQDPQTRDFGSGGPSSLMFIVRGGYEFGGEPFFDEGFDGELLVGDRVGQKAEVYLYAGFNSLETRDSHSVSESIKGDVLTLGVGMEGRFYPLSGMPYFSPYLLGRFGGFIMFWEFKNALQSGNEIIDSDMLGGIMVGVGAGVDIIRSESFKLGIAIIPELSLYGEETGEGFTNDFFDQQGITRICAEAGFSF
jgi:hypothetical protein